MPYRNLESDDNQFWALLSEAIWKTKEVSASNFFAENFKNLWSPE